MAELGKEGGLKRRWSGTGGRLSEAELGGGGSGSGIGVVFLRLLVVERELAFSFGIAI